MSATVAFWLAYLLDREVDAADDLRCTAAEAGSDPELAVPLDQITYLDHLSHQAYRFACLRAGVAPDSEAANTAWQQALNDWESEEA